MASPAETLRTRLAQYAYSPSSTPKRSHPVSPSPRRSPRVAASTAESPSRGSRRSARASGSATPVVSASASGYVSDVESGSGSGSDYEPKPEIGSDDEPPPGEPRRLAIPKRRADGTLRKYGWKKPRAYASPEIYAHLRPVEDCMEVGLKCELRGYSMGRLAADSSMVLRYQPRQALQQARAPLRPSHQQVLGASSPRLLR